MNFKLYFTVASADVYCTFRIRRSITVSHYTPITQKKTLLKGSVNQKIYTLVHATFCN
jgi:hypothetical protein